MTVVTANPVPFGAFEIFQMTNKKPSLLTVLRGWVDVLTTRRVLAHLTYAQMEDIGLNGVKSLTVSKLIERA